MSDRLNRVTGVVHSTRKYQRAGWYGALLWLAAISGSLPIRAQSPAEAVLFNFSAATKGAYPNSLITDAAGNVYGVTAAGGAHNFGVIFEVPANGAATVLYNFTGTADGFSPVGIARDSAGNIYASVANGGHGQCGTLFKLDPAGHHSVVYAFKGRGDGCSPSSPPVLDKAGNLYGAVAFGVAGSGYAGVYKWDASTARESAVALSVQPPTGAVVLNGTMLCGVTGNGGVFGSGMIFVVDLPKKAWYSLHDFTGGVDGGLPIGGLTLGPNGKIYGTASTGGSHQAGVAFEIGTALTSSFFKVVYNFPGGAGGASPASNVTLDASGNLYGVTSGGGSDQGGVVYKIDATRQESVLSNVPAAANAISNQTSGLGGLAIDNAGDLFGTLLHGVTGIGQVFKIDSGGQETVPYNFPPPVVGSTPHAAVIDQAGNLYGTTSSGGAFNQGAIYKMDAAGHQTVLFSFPGGSGGSDPEGGVILDVAGNLYGTTNLGGLGYGLVYKIDTNLQETVLYSFTNQADGSYPQGNLVMDSLGNLFGITPGADVQVQRGIGFGNVYQISPSGQFSVLYAFQGGPDGDGPTDGLSLDSAGNLYGTTYWGGQGGGGSIFMVNPSGQETQLYSFMGNTDGYNPIGGVILDAAGNLYGTSSPEVYQYSASGQFSTLYAFQGGPDPAGPYSALTLDSAGNLYGASPSGGMYNHGTVYEITPSGQEIILYNFTGGADGGSPVGIALDSSGVLYGAAASGGAHNTGAVFKVTP